MCLQHVKTLRRSVMIHYKDAKNWCFLVLLSSAAMDCTKAVAQDATAYQVACGECHPAPAAIARKIKGETEDEKRAYLTNLLKRHHPPDPVMIDGIIGYLLALPKK